MISKLTMIFMVLSLLAFNTYSADNSCFIKDGDKVGFFGDSITAHKVYGELVERIFRHCHPEAKVEFVNNGQSGLQLAGTKLKLVIKGDPNVITIMIGMNDSINSKWVRGNAIPPKIEKGKYIGSTGPGI